MAQLELEWLQGIRIQIGQKYSCNAIRCKDRKGNIFRKGNLPSTD